MKGVTRMDRLSNENIRSEVNAIPKHHVITVCRDKWGILLKELFKNITCTQRKIEIYTRDLTIDGDGDEDDNDDDDDAGTIIT